MAHALAWAVGLWLAFWPTYSGVSVTPALPGSETTPFSDTLIGVNGLYVIWLLAVPVLLTGLALLALRTANTRRRVGRTILLWVPAVALLGFCAVAILSIGVFYLPAALSLLIAASADCIGSRNDVQETVHSPLGRIEWR